MRGIALAAWVAGFVLAGSAARAEEEAADAEASKGFALEVSGGVDFTTHYFFRGILNEDHALILQPFVEVAGDIGPVSVAVGNWNSIHTGTSGDSSPWYEADLYVTASMGLAQTWSVSATYTWYLSPNDSFDAAEGLDLQVAYDDGAGRGSVFDRRFLGFQPSATLGIETLGQSDGGTAKGIYLGLAVAPALALVEHGDSPLTLTLPVTVGLSLGDYYQDDLGNDDTFGYVEVGADLEVPLGLVSDSLGSWDMTLGTHVLFLGDHARAFNDGDAVELVMSVGFHVAF